MEIQEIERKTGMTRANIRFYETKGLLSPARRENGYRDYSEEDAETLRRIFLLRRLGMTVETIRALQKGEETLQSALMRQIGVLDETIRRAETAKSVCMAIEADGVSYASLDAGRYLDMYDKACLSAETVIDRDREYYVPHPWRRLLARTLDLALYLTVFEAVMLLAFKIVPPEIFSLIAQLFLMLALEPVMLRFFGTTPGKALMGIHISNGGGGRPDYESALMRTWEVLKNGLGFSLPIYSIFREYKSYQQCMDGDMPWDEMYDCDVICRDISWRNVTAYIGAYIVLTAAVIGCAFTLLLPPNRGNITVSEFAENCNYYIKDSAYKMNKEGQWEQKEGIADLSNQELSNPDIIFTTENGYVTGISYSISGTGSVVMFDAVTMAAPAPALMLSRRSAGAFDGDTAAAAELAQHLFEEGTHIMTVGDVELTWTVTSENIAMFGSAAFSKEDSNGSMTVSLSARIVSD